MEAERLSVKFFLESANDIDLDALVPVFHRWIRENVLPELVLDVVDYKHVHHGPGVVLIGHASDYYLDQGEGRPGLLYSRKRQAPAPAERLEDAFRRALHACALLEREALPRPLKFRADEVLLKVSDQLRAPNSDAGYSALEVELAPFLGRLYAGTGCRVERMSPSAGALSARIHAEAAPTIAALLERLGGPPKSA